MNATFVEAAAILLREGADDRLRALWLGAAAALAASIGAAWIFEQFYNGTHNDIFEGVVIFLAAGLLFYVSGWLFLKQDPKSWQDYLRKQTDKALAARSWYIVAALA